MIPKLFLSYRFDLLLKELIENLNQEAKDPLQTQIIVVPNGQMKQWLLLEIAKIKGIAMGLKVIEIEQLIPAASSSCLELFCHLYILLKQASDEEIVSYIDGKKKRILDLADQLLPLFLRYGQFDLSLFENDSKQWQQKILQTVCSERFLRFAVQMNPSFQEEIILFGIDFLPPIYWQFLMTAPHLSIYLFSPCVEFWIDLTTDRERKSILRYWEKRGASLERREELEMYLKQSPKLLANWGKLGRQTLKIIENFDFESFEIYPSFEPTTLLKQFQLDLLHLRETKNPKIDDSIKLILTGSSKLREIEALKEEIAQLQLPYHEISVLAPDIEPYIPLIEFVFSGEIPYRISGFDLAHESLFRQGLIRLLSLYSGRWGREELFALFETPSFYRKQGWKEEVLEDFRAWAFSIPILWGKDEAHWQLILEKNLGAGSYPDQGSWEKGIKELLDAIVFYKEREVNPERLAQLFSILHDLKKMDLEGEKTLSSWADLLEEISSQFLKVDLTDEADVAAQHAFFSFLQDLRKYPYSDCFPLSVIQHLLERPCKGQIHASHLHAVRFSSIKEGALLPAKALFLIGMDEESFPKPTSFSSFDLLKKQVPLATDCDRYLFLQAIFSSIDYLRFSYSHLSAEEGKPVGPSFLIQELCGAIGPLISTVYQPKQREEGKKRLSWPNLNLISFSQVQKILSSQRGLHRESDSSLHRVISISDLKKLARHPWRFYLQKVCGIYLQEEREDSFYLQRARLIKASLEKPLEEVFLKEKLPSGLFGEALKIESQEKASEWQQRLKQWDLKPFPLILQEHCQEAHFDGDSYRCPPLEVSIDGHLISLVGEIPSASSKGFICTSDDQISATLKIWPEALITAICLKEPQIWKLKNGKIKSLKDPKEELKKFMEYFFHALIFPSPLIPDWTDPLLRKGKKEFERKVHQKGEFEDCIADWVLSRAEGFHPEEIFEKWNPFLKRVFQGLIELYPSQGDLDAKI